MGDQPQQVVEPEQIKPEDNLLKDYLPKQYPNMPQRFGLRPYHYEPRYWQDKALSYWENPQRVARYQQVMKAQPPGAQPVPWLDHGTLGDAYNALQDYNKNEMWWNWQPLPYDHALSPALREMAPPPLPMLASMGEEKYYQPTEPEALPSPDQAGMTDEMWGQLPRWQRLMISALQSPVFGGVMGGLPGAMIGGSLAGPWGAAGGALLGGGAGIYAQKNPDSTLASVLLYLDLPREWVEQRMGMISQVAGSITDPAKYGEIPTASWEELSKWLTAAGQAGSIYTAGTSSEGLSTGQQLLKQYPQLADSNFDYENFDIGTPGNIDFLNAMASADIALDPIMDWVGKTFNRPTWVTPDGLEVTAGRGEVWMPGSSVPIAAPDVGAAMIEMRMRILAGEKPNEVIQEYTQKYGLTGNVREMVIGFVIDPLNYLPLATSKGGAAISSALGAEDLAVAFRTTHGITEAAQKYGVLKRATTPINELSQMNGLARWLTGVDKGGNVKILAPGDSQGGFFRYLLSMKPQSRATEVVNTSAANLALVLSRLVDPSEDDLVNLIKALANTPDDVARDLSMRSIQAPDGAAIPLFLKDFTDIADEFLLKYKAVEPNRRLLHGLAEVTDLTPAEVLQKIANAQDAEVLLRTFVDAARKKGGGTADNIVAAYDATHAAISSLSPEEQITGAKLTEMVKIFTEDQLPHDMDTFRAQLYTAAMDVGAEWAAGHFNVKPDPGWVRASQMVKSAQSLMLLGLNPTYFVNNVLNNLVTSAATGVFGVRSAKVIDGIWARAGIEPPRLRAGVGPIALGEELSHAAIREAVQAPGALTEVTRFFNERTRKLQIFSNLSMTAEQMASAQAYTAGFVQFMGRHWKEGTGFHRMPAPLERALGQINQDLPALIYGAIKGGMNQTEIEKLLWGGLSRRTVDSAVPTLAERFRQQGVNLSEADITELLRHSGVDDLLRDKLSTAQNDADVRGAFDDANVVIQERLDLIVARDLEREAAEITGRMSTEGLPAVLELFDQRQLEFTERWFENFAEWEKAFTDTENMSYGDRNLVMRHVAAEQQRKWTRYYVGERTKYQAIVNGLGIDAVENRRIIDLVDTAQQNNKGFFELRNKKNHEFFNTKYDTTIERQVGWDTLQAELMEAYNDMTSKEIRIAEEMDQALVGYLEGKYGPEAGAAGALWRTGVNEIRVNMVQEMRAMRDALRNMPVSERRTAWTAFLHGKNGYLTQIGEYFRKNVDGAHELYNTLRGRGGEAVPPGALAPEPAPGGAAPSHAAPPSPALPIMITYAMKATLRQLGYSVDDISAMKPDAAWKIINDKIAVSDETWGKTKLAETPTMPVPPEPLTPGPVQDLSPVGRKVVVKSNGVSFEGLVVDNVKTFNDGSIQVRVQRDGETVSMWYPLDAVEGIKGRVREPVEIPKTLGPTAQAQFAENAKVAAAAGIPLVNAEGNRISGAEIHLMNAIKKYGGDEAKQYTRFEEVPTELVQKALDERIRIKTEEDLKWMPDAIDEIGAPAPEVTEVHPIDKAILENRLGDLPDDIRAEVEQAYGELAQAVDASEQGYRIARQVDDQGGTMEWSGVESSYPDWWGDLKNPYYKDAAGKKYTAKAAVQRVLKDLIAGEVSPKNQKGDDYILVKRAKGQVLEYMTDKKAYQVATGAIDISKQAKNIHWLGQNIKNVWDHPGTLRSTLNELNDLIADISDIPYEKIKLDMDYALDLQDTILARLEELGRIPPEQLTQMVDDAQRLARAELSMYESRRLAHDFQMEQGVPPSDLFQKPQQQGMWGAGEDTPLFTGAAQKADESVFRVQDVPVQEQMPGFEPQMKGAKVGGEASGPLFEASARAGLFRRQLRQKMIDHLLGGQENVLAGVWDVQSQADAVLSIMDARANIWAKDTGRNAYEWYEHTFADIKPEKVDVTNDAYLLGQLESNKTTEGYAAFVDGNKVVDKNGDALVVYHGTTHEFRTFDPANKGNLDNYMGRGIYFTDSIDDVNANYAGFGPDLTGRIEGVAESIGQQLLDDPYDVLHLYEKDVMQFFGLTEEQFYNLVDNDWDRLVEMIEGDVDGIADIIARKHVAGNTEGVVMPVYLRMENPAILDKKGGEYIDFMDVYDADLDWIVSNLEDDPGQYIEQIRKYKGWADDYEPDDLKLAIEDNLYDIADEIVIPEEDTQVYKMQEALREALYDVEVYEETAESLMRKVMEDHIDGASLFEIVSTIQKVLFESEAQIDTGMGLEYAANEVTRRMLENMGYDGIIHSAGEAFPHMTGTNGAKHYIAFDSAKVKSVFNMGDFDPSNPDIYYQRSLPQAPAREAGDMGVNVSFRDITEGSIHTFDETVIPLLESNGGAYAIAEDPVGGYVLDSVWSGQNHYDTLHEARRAAWEEAFTKAANGEVMFQEVNNAPAWYYSKLNDHVYNKMPGRMNIDEFRNFIKKGGIKAEELLWTGLDDWLEGREALIDDLSYEASHIPSRQWGDKWWVHDTDGNVVGGIFDTKAEADTWIGARRGQVTKDEVVAYLNRNQIEVSETLRGVPPGYEGQLDIAAAAKRANSDLEQKVNKFYDEIYNEFYHRYMDVLDYPPDDAIRISERNTHEYLHHLDGRLEPELREYIETRRGAQYLEEAEAARTDYWENVELVREYSEAADYPRTKYSQYSITPGIEGDKHYYRELLLQWAPETEAAKARSGKLMFEYGSMFDIDEFYPVNWTDAESLGYEAGTDLRIAAHDEFMDKAQFAIKEAQAKGTRQVYKSAHWDEPNILAHVRFSEFRDTTGDLVLYIDEIQSDWHQAGRSEGYNLAEPGVADNLLGEWEEKFNIMWDGYEKQMASMEIWEELARAKRLLEEKNEFTQPVWDIYHRTPTTPEGNEGFIERYYDRDAARQAAIDWYEPLKERDGYGFDIRARQEYVNPDNAGLLTKIDRARSNWDFDRQNYQALAGTFDGIFHRANGKYYHGVPDAPFKRTWSDLAMKRMLHWASEKGYDRIAWSTGEIQNKRYNLAQYYAKIEWEKVPSFAGGDPDNVRLTLHSIDGSINGLDTSTGRLSEYVGDGVAERILNDTTLRGALEGDRDLAVGGTGMKTFYDQMVTNSMAKMGKKFGVMPEDITLYRGTLSTETIRRLNLDYIKDPNKSGMGTKVHGMDINDPMRSSVLNGQPLFSEKKGAVQFLNDGRAMIYALENPDVSTVIHELGHVFRMDLRKTIAQAVDDPTAARLMVDYETASKWAGVVQDADGEFLWSGEAAQRIGIDSDQYRAAVRAEEKFARGFEEYLMMGDAPNPALVPVFEKFKEWLAHVYARLRGDLAGVSPEMKAVYDRLLSEYPEAADYPITTEMGRAKVPSQGQMFQPAGPVNSYNFTNWFGDSKVLADDGTPLAVYHGTRQEFDAFDPTKSSDFGIHFGTTEQADTIVGGKYKILNKQQYLRGAQMHEVYLSIQNPLRVKDYSWWGQGLNALMNREGDFIMRKKVSPFLDADKMFREAEVAVSSLVHGEGRYKLSTLPGLDDYTIKQIRRMIAEAGLTEDVLIYEPGTLTKWRNYLIDAQAKNKRNANVIIIREWERLGYDGMVYFNEAEGVGDSWIAFRPEQVKATRNAGEWNPTDPNMLHQAGLEYENGYNTELLYQGDIPEPTSPLGEVEGNNPGPPLGRIQEEAFRNHIRPIMNGLEDVMTGESAQVPQNISNFGAGLEDGTMRQMKAYMGQVYGDLADTKLAGVRWAENRRDAALLNYSRRYGFDNFLSAIYPYQFWYTRTAMQWALRFIDKPGWLSNYARIRNFQRTTLQTPGFPMRLKNKMKMPVPFLPSWAGGGIYVDPLRQIFPFEQFARPWEQRAEDQNMVTKRAQSMLSQWADDGEEDPQAVKDALETQSGSLWAKAVSSAELDVESDTTNPWDFMQLIMSPSMPVDWVSKWLRGDKDKISQTPATRLIQNVSGALGANKGRGYNIEGPIRRVLDMPEQDRFHDYRVDRELSNLAAEGVITPEAATLAMTDQSGEAFLVAQQRAAQTQQIKYLGGALGADLFPEGEQKQRALKLEYDQAREAEDAGQKGAINQFFDKYPEYEARSLLFKEDPEERLRFFLRGQIWEAWLSEELPALHKKQLGEQLGDVFTQAFLNPETRSYDSIDTPTLTQWARLLKGVMPETAPETPGAQVQLADEGETAAYQSFVDERNQKFPNIGQILGVMYEAPVEAMDQFKGRFPEIDDYYTWRNKQFATHPEILPYALSELSEMADAPQDVQALYYQFQYQRDTQFPGIFDIQDGYYQIDPGDKKAKAAYREQYPQLVDYWDWRREFMRQYPNMIPYIMSEESLAEAVLGDEQSYSTGGSGGSSGVSVSGSYGKGRGYDIDLNALDPVLARMLYAHYRLKEPLEEGAQKALQRYWKSQGRPGENFNEFLDEILRRYF